MIPPASEVKSARQKLDAALQGVVAPRREGGGSPRSESDEEVEESLASREKKPPRKRRRKDDYDDGGSSYHHTYVMKLFDRSVDLAQFKETTSLYPIARAWIRNQPHGKSNRFTDDDDDVETDGTRRRDRSKDAGSTDVIADDEAERRSSAHSIADVHRLPPPGVPPSTESCSRIPEVLAWSKEDFFIHSEDNPSEMEQFNPPSQDVLLMNHLSRWRTIRGQWKQQSAINESRYSESMSLLKTMFEDSQANMT